MTAAINPGIERASDTDPLYILGLYQSFEDGYNAGGADSLRQRYEDAKELLEANASDPSVLAAYQAAVSEVTIFRNAQSSTMKAFKDIAASIVANYR